MPDGDFCKQSNNNIIVASACDLQSIRGPDAPTSKGFDLRRLRIISKVVFSGYILLLLVEVKNLAAFEIIL